MPPARPPRQAGPISARQNIYHRITVTLGDGSTRDVRVRGSLWKTLAAGDRVTKRAGEKAPVKVAQETTTE
jgi:hypothetical protein